MVITFSSTLCNKYVVFDSHFHIPLSRLLSGIEISGCTVLGVRVVRQYRPVLLPHLFPSRAIQALIYLGKHLNNDSITDPERVLIFYLLVALQILLKQPLTLSSQSISCNIVKTASSYPGKTAKMLGVTLISKFFLTQTTFFFFLRFLQLLLINPLCMIPHIFTPLTFTSFRYLQTVIMPLFCILLTTPFPSQVLYAISHFLIAFLGRYFSLLLLSDSCEFFFWKHDRHKPGKVPGKARLQRSEHSHNFKMGIFNC